MIDVEEIGFVLVVWGISALLFRDWVVRLDLALRRRLTGEFVAEAVMEEQRRLLERTARIILAVGLPVFACGVGLRLQGLG